MTMIKRSKPAPAPVAAAPAAAPAKPRPAPAPIRKVIPIERKAEIVSELKAIGDELGYRSDYERVEQRYLARIHNPMTAIRARCVQCCCGQPGEVAKCTAKTCALHPFRMGVNPFNKKVRARLAGQDAGTDVTGEDADDADADVDSEE